ncbi:hypothetical protein NDU88_004300 [Pleurodeles waltl]|uniref:Integrase catalytic domain-containing protein n=1 Tax=Pleurodeles waltl TaxID=8319 RepID=A0AAV7KY17_PLEWA|nr:hypothetical protein NDU88_004300 [Pleurodeles waltl]
MWDECGVNYRFTTPYHPQTNGLVGRFNKTLKALITGLPKTMRQKCDILLPCILFAYREVPQKGVGFSPFELLYGYAVRGPLSIVKEGWEKAPKKPPQDVVSYMLALHKQTQRFWKQAKSNIKASQEVMKEWYDQKYTLVEFSPGDKVWVMEPVEPRALQNRWTGSFEVKERKGEATYLVDFKTPRHPRRVLHHNRLKPHLERSDVSLLLVTDEGMEEESEPLPDLLSAKESDRSQDKKDFIPAKELLVWQKLPCSLQETTQNLLRGEKITACRTGSTQPDFPKRKTMQRQRCDRKFDAQPTGLTQSRARTTQPDFLR